MQLFGICLQVVSFCGQTAKKCWYKCIMHYAVLLMSPWCYCYDCSLLKYNPFFRGVNIYFRCTVMLAMYHCHLTKIFVYYKFATPLVVPFHLNNHRLRSMEGNFTCFVDSMATFQIKLNYKIDRKPCQIATVWRTLL